MRQPLTILLFEDYPEIAEDMANLFKENRGDDVKVYTDSDALMNELSQEGAIYYDIAVIDFSSGEGKRYSGSDLIRGLRIMNPTKPIILHTAYRDAYCSDADSILQKMLIEDLYIWDRAIEQAFEKAGRR